MQSKRNGHQAPHPAWNTKHLRSPLDDSVLAVLSPILGTAEKRGRLLLVLAPPGSGVTTIVKRFASTHPRRHGLDAEKLQVVYVDAPPTPGVRRLTKTILRAYLPGPNVVRSNAELISRLKVYLTECDTRILIIDDGNHLLDGNTTVVRATLSLLGELIDKTGVCIVTVGASRLLSAIMSSPSLSEVAQVVEAEPFKNDSYYRRFVAHVSRSIPLEHKQLTNEPLRSALFEKSMGFPGRIIIEVRKAFVAAIAAGDSAIEPRHFGYTPHGGVE